MRVPYLTEARRSFHAGLLDTILRTDSKGVVSIADKDSRASVALARGLLDKLHAKSEGARLKGQMSGSQFEQAVQRFLQATFLELKHIRPGDWEIVLGTRITKYEQYVHLEHLQSIARSDRQLAAAIGTDYVIKPDVLVIRNPVDDATLNRSKHLVDGHVAMRTSLRIEAKAHATLHASISCKWTLRSDRAQNARSEALNLIRTRKGRVPHIAVVTAEPLPSRLASLALGTGDLDCVYHIALPELLQSADDLVNESAGSEEVGNLLRLMVEGKRLKDIADLPLDLAV